MGRLLDDRRVGYVAACVLPALTTLVVLGLPLRRGPWPVVGVLYLAVALVVATRVGPLAGFAALVEGAVLLDYYFVGPADNLSIPNPADVDVFVSLILLGAVVTAVVGWIRARDERLRTALALTQAQAEVAQLRASSDLVELSAQTGALVERAADQHYLALSSAATIEDVADRLARGTHRASTDELVAELRATAAALRARSETYT